MERDRLLELLRAASEEHERTNELLAAQRAPGGLRAAAARSGDAASPGTANELETRLVWIFGSPRSGSSWLLKMLDARSELATIDETYLGAHLVPVGFTVTQGEYWEHGHRAEDPSYFFARRYLPVFRPLLRELVLRGLENQVRHLKRGVPPRWVVIKEPNSSHATDTLLSLVPSSRMLFLLRDGRDVIDSLIDAMLREKSWWEGPRTFLHPDRAVFISQEATQWVLRTITTQRAFAALPEERRLLVRYEELLANTPAQLRRIFDWLDLDVSDGDVEALAARHAFKAVPKNRRGPGQAVRAATPGLWRRNLTPEEQQAIHEVMGDKLRELGYEA